MWVKEECDCCGVQGDNMATDLKWVCDYCRDHTKDGVCEHEKECGGKPKDVNIANVYIDGKYVTGSKPVR